MHQSEAVARMKVLCAGEIARDILLSGRQMAVFAAFERSFYLRTEQDELVCLGEESLAPGPLMALCTPWPALEGLLAVGDAVRRIEYGLIIGRCLVCPEAMTLWNPPRFPENNLFCRSWLSNQLAINDRIKPPLAGLAPLLPCILDPSQHPFPERLESSMPNTEALLQREAWHGLMRLERWLSIENTCVTENLVKAVQCLLGLGPGLTPSGDDALAGVLITLSALNLSESCQILSSVIEEYAPRATNAISRAHLRAAASGLGGAPVLDAVRILMEGENSVPLQGTLNRLSQIGHSSGWDAFTGVVLTLISLSSCKD